MLDYTPSISPAIEIFDDRIATASGDDPDDIGIAVIHLLMLAECWNEWKVAGL